MVRKKRSSLAITRAVIFALLLREMQTRFGSRRMGAFWLMFEPIASIAVLMFIFTVVRARHVPGMDFPVFLLTGIVPFMMMRNIALKLMDSVEANRALFAYRNITIFDTYIARVLVECSIMSCVYAILLFVLGFWFGYDVSIAYPVQWFAALAHGVLFAMGLGVFLSIIVQAMPNAKSFIRLLFMPLYLISGVVFPLWIIPHQYLPWVLWNPFAHLVDNMRSAVFVNYPVIPGVNVSYPLVITIVFLFAALGLYRVRKEALLTR